MEKTAWKTIAIILFIILVLLISFITWGFHLLEEEEEKMNECYYNVCEGYAQAYYEEGVCTCYNLGDDGYWTEGKTQYI